MQVAYPLVRADGNRGRAARVGGIAWRAAGARVFGFGKAIKFWAIASLGPRWSFRVLVLPGRRCHDGPYRWMRHPNYVGVMGEIAGMAIALSAS